jgi:hypothetical protein
VQRRGREDHVHRLVEVEVEVEPVLAPHLGAVAQPIAGERHHVRRRVDRQHAASRDKVEQRLGDAAGAAAHIEHRGIRSDPPEPGQDIRHPGLLRLA